MIRLLSKNGQIVGAEEFQLPDIGESMSKGGEWVPLEVHSLDTPPKRTLAEELRIVWESIPATEGDRFSWNAVASKAKEVLLGDDMVDGVASIVFSCYGNCKESSKTTAKKILEYLREQT